MVGVVLKHALQMSDSVEVAAFLAFSGGVMDAYSYLVRGGVFANAQTGNLLLFGINLTSGSFEKCLKYALPILAFAIGIALSYAIRAIAREEHLHTHDSSHIETSLLYFGTIFCFVAGAVVGNLLIPLLGTHMIWLSPAALLVVILIMFIDREKQVLEAHGKSAK